MCICPRTFVGTLKCARRARHHSMSAVSEVSIAPLDVATAVVVALDSRTTTAATTTSPSTALGCPNTAACATDGFACSTASTSLQYTFSLPTRICKILQIARQYGNVQFSILISMTAAQDAVKFQHQILGRPSQAACRHLHLFNSRDHTHVHTHTISFLRSTTRM